MAGGVAVTTSRRKSLAGESGWVIIVPFTYLQTTQTVDYRKALFEIAGSLRSRSLLPLEDCESPLWFYTNVADDYAGFMVAQLMSEILHLLMILKATIRESSVEYSGKWHFLYILPDT